MVFIINYTLLEALEVDSKLDNNIFITRSLFKKTDYSFCLISGFDNGSSEPIIDYSFENYLIRAGRIKRLGIWRELFSPLGVSANSDLFTESAGFGNNYSFYRGGLYGFSLEMDEGTGISLLFPDDLWLGANYTRASDFFIITGFISISAFSEIPSDDWESTYSNIPDTNPIHLGLNSILKWPGFTIDYLGSLSGSSSYKAGSYNRLFIELSGRSVSLKGYGGIISPYFISTDLKLSDTRYLLSLYFGLNLFKNWEAVFKTEYQEDHNPVLPAAYVPSSGGSSVKLKYDNSCFYFSNKLEQKFNFDIYGTESLENSFEGRLGLSSKFSAFIDYGFSFDFDSLTKRRVGLNLKTEIQKTDIELTFKHSEEIFEPDDTNIIKLSVDQEIGSGAFYFKVEIGKKLEGLSIGFESLVF